MSINICVKSECFCSGNFCLKILSEQHHVLFPSFNQRRRWISISLKRIPPLFCVKLTYITSHPHVDYNEKFAILAEFWIWHFLQKKSIYVGYLISFRWKFQDLTDLRVTNNLDQVWPSKIQEHIWRLHADFKSSSGNPHCKKEQPCWPITE